MVEAGISATAVFTEVKDRQLKPFALKDSAGNPLSGVIPLNSRPVLGAGGFQVSAHHPFNFATDRFSIAPEGTFGLAWGSNYATMFWSATANVSTHFLNGNARITGKLGYGGYKVESDTMFPETRHGLKIEMEGAVRLMSDLNFVSQAGVTLTPDGPQTLVPFGAQWLFNKRPEPPVDLDGSLGRQSLAAAAQQLDHMDQIYTAMGVGPKDALVDQILALGGITSAFIKNESYARIPPINDELAKAGLSLDYASNNNINISLLSPYRVRINKFKEIRNWSALF